MLTYDGLDYAFADSHIDTPSAAGT
ncbi:protein of unknown function [Methylorubrum extorquens DM4]|uniref:Uncharacterized protein n=1 Tax=Methylorubrum extorquens (strain DSM 6343 / CIP 106787 / DM4) TaxID=661410 RepID=C7CC99_METED|nr:protein of unknown function [Methylorubrum extorquens DM4]